MPEHQLRGMARSFPEWAHAGQLPLEGDWRTWVIKAGRGFGKTRAGAEWVLDCVRGGSDERDKMTPSPSGRGRGGGSTPALTRGCAALPPPRPFPGGEGSYPA